MITLVEHESRFGLISILRTKRTGSVIYRQAGHFQSEADGQGISLASYIHAIFGLIAQTCSRHVLMIGCGGGTLATMLVKARQEVTIVDADPAAFELGRRYFRLPTTVRCKTDDGYAFLTADANVYDAIVLDAFEGNRIPAHLQSPAFFRQVRRRLNPSGCVLANVHVTHDLDHAPDRLATGMANVFPQVRVLDTQGIVNRNAIVIGAAKVDFDAPSLLMPPNISAREIGDELAAMRFRAWRQCA